MSRSAFAVGMATWSILTVGICILLMPRGYVLASVPLSLNTERLAMLKHQIAGPGQRKCSEGRALLAYGSLSQKTRVDIVHHWQMPLKPACRGKAGGVSELLCTLLPARSMVPDMITIYCSLAVSFSPKDEGRARSALESQAKP